MYQPISPCPAPTLTLDTKKVEAFEYLLLEARRLGPDAFIDYNITYPKHEFLRYLVDREQILLHGSNRSDLKVLLPMSPTFSLGSNLGITNDPRAAMKRQFVFASAESMLPMFFAILDYAKYAGSTSIWAYRLRDATGQSTIHYFFSINEKMLKLRPFRSGTIYLLPREKFKPGVEDYGIIMEEWVSQEPVPVLAKLSIAPEDFPLLDAIWGHDEGEVARLTETIKKSLAAVEGVSEEANGYRFRFPGGDEWANRLNELCRLQQKFCPFLVFKVVREASDGPIYLEATGPEGAKQLIRSVLGMNS